MIFKHFSWQLFLAIGLICTGALGLDHYLQTNEDMGSKSILLSFAASMLASWFMAWRLSLPLRNVRNHMLRMAKGEVPENVKVVRTSVLEINQLVEAVDQIRDQMRNRISTILLQKNELDALFASMDEGVLAVDHNLRIIQINKSGLAILGLADGAVLLRSVLEVIRVPDLLKIIQEGLGRKEKIERDIQIDGSNFRYVQVHLSPLRFDQEKDGVVLVFRDVTRIRELEGMRKGFVANVSHELRTPLTSIQGFAETLLNPNVKDPNEIKKFLEIIQRHASRLGRIIEDILALSSIERDHEKGDIVLKRDDVSMCLHNAVELCLVKAKKKNINLSLVAPPGLFANLDPYLFEQAVVNLIDNAIRYTDDGKSVQVLGAIEKDRIVVSVQDEGMGIPRVHLDRIFERFYRVDTSRSRELGGTGLGLSIVKHIVTAHHGEISVESVLGQGTKFTVVLPKG
jgi:two-component system phosphate regulon sensor histidine kinase PhoR